MTRKIIIEAADVTDEVVEWFYDNAIEGWYEDGPVDWEEAIDRADDRGGNPEFDFGPSYDSPAIRKLMREVRRIRRENGIGQ